MTITSNIHLGIAGWSNATYTAGQRRSNAGNAYQVITGGTSTSPPTGTGSSINNGGTAGPGAGGGGGSAFNGNTAGNGTKGGDGFVYIVEEY